MRESSPLRVFVGDSGWSVLLLHGWEKNELLVFSPEGEQTGVLDVVPQEYCKGTEHARIEVQRYAASTTGWYWYMGCFSTFVDLELSPYFVVETPWRVPIVLDLKSGEPVEAPSRPLQKQLRAGQAEHCQTYLLSAAQSGDDWPRLHADLLGAILLLCRLGGESALDTLRALRALPDYEFFQTGCKTLTDYADRWTYGLAPILQAAFRHLGRKPKLSWPNYSLHQEEREIELPATRAPGLDKIPESAGKTLEQFGPPHYLESFSEQEDSGRYQWGEHWDYYLEVGAVVKTLHLTWEPGGKTLRKKEVVDVDLLKRLAEMCALYDRIRL